LTRKAVEAGAVALLRKAAGVGIWTLVIPKP
jgi:hypothetical protein